LIFLLNQRLPMAKDSGAKKLFRIGEVSQLTGINPHILRYWESEFQILAPNRRLSKQRLYRQVDIDLILEIKRLLEDEKYTLQGVKQYLAERLATLEFLPPSSTLPFPDNSHSEAIIQMVREDLLAIRKILNGKKLED
jgi:DNA-binding transcriptional MerR regulator